MDTPQRELIRYRKERSGKRDEYHYSNRHGLYGRKIYMINLDFMELNGTKAVLAGDLKHSAERVIDLDDFETRCYRDNFQCALVYLQYYYWDKAGNILRAEDIDTPIDHAQYYVIAINKKAEEMLSAKEKWMTEIEWVRFLHDIRDCKDPIANNWHFSQTLKKATKPSVIGDPL